MRFVRGTPPSAGQVIDFLATCPWNPTFYRTKCSCSVYRYGWQKRYGLQQGCPREDLLISIPLTMSFIGTLSQTLTLRAAFASSTYLLSQIPGPGRSSYDDLLIPLIHFSRGHIRAYGLSIAAGLPCPPTPARHLMMPLVSEECRYTASCTI